MRLEPQQAAPPFSVEAIDGETRTLEQFAGKPLLLMFHRYAACPMCNIRLHDFAKRFPALHQRGLEAIAFFHSPANEIRKHAGRRQYPFALAADPKFRAYRRYGVETSWSRLAMSVARPSVYAELVRALRQGFRGGKPTFRLAQMPADFLIGPDGRIRIAFYARNIADHLPPREIEDAVNEIYATENRRGQRS
ncbi:MAG: AhpC/TSA family protein [Planctomycetes bacterium]|nr:AhpC/TSA family protein [Planctomycetota bacterium]